MVWVYGGANQYGSNAVPAYDGGSFAKDGVILVSINYRLGALGFFAHPALTKAAGGDSVTNYGLMDQMAALRWVRRNITAFGGDPHNVTLVGESADGVDVLALMTAPDAKGLFRRVIVESGGGWGAPVVLAGAKREGQALALKEGLSTNASADELRAASERPHQPSSSLWADCRRSDPTGRGHKGVCPRPRNESSSYHRLKQL